MSEHEQEQGRERKKRWTPKVWAGFGLVLLCHLVWLLLYLINPEFLSAYLAIGVAQVVYVIPLAVWFGIKDRRMLQGVLLAALLTFLLNAACFGIVIYQLNNGSI